MRDIADHLGFVTAASLRAHLGYYEASKYQVQTLLRPVFVISASSMDVNNPWAEHIVIAATEVEGVSEDSGIEA